MASSKEQAVNSENMFNSVYRFICINLGGWLGAGRVNYLKGMFVRSSIWSISTVWITFGNLCLFYLWETGPLDLLPHEGAPSVDILTLDITNTNFR